MSLSSILITFKLDCFRLFNATVYRNSLNYKVGGLEVGRLSCCCSLTWIRTRFYYRLSHMSAGVNCQVRNEDNFVSKATLVFGLSVVVGWSTFEMKWNEEKKQTDAMMLTKKNDKRFVNRITSYLNFAFKYNLKFE